MNQNKQKEIYIDHAANSRRLDAKSSMRTIAVEDVGNPIFNHDDCQHMYTMRVV